mgnify:CR=1 FL=1
MAFEEKAISEFKRLWRSTKSLHVRFGTLDELTVVATLDYVNQEYGEVMQAQLMGDEDNLREELVDLAVTVMGLCMAKGIKWDDLRYHLVFFLDDMPTYKTPIYWHRLGSVRAQLESSCLFPTFFQGGDAFASELLSLIAYYFRDDMTYFTSNVQIVARKNGAKTDASHQVVNGQIKRRVATAINPELYNHE